MALRSERFDLDVPTDFPIASFEAVHAAISDPDDERRELRQRPAWGEWAAASNGLLFRYIAFADQAEPRLTEPKRANDGADGKHLLIRAFSGTEGAP